MQFSTSLSSSGGIIFIDKIILDFKLFLIKFIGYIFPIFHKIGNAKGVNILQMRSVHNEGETPLRLDNLGKKCRAPFIYTL